MVYCNLIDYCCNVIDYCYNLIIYGCDLMNHLQGNVDRLVIVML